MLCILPACNINNNVVSDTEYLTEIDLSPAPAQDKSDAMDKSFALMATLGADALVGSEGLTLGTALSLPLGPLAPVGGIVVGGASYATGAGLSYIFSGGGNTNAGGTNGENPGGPNGGNNPGGGNGNKGGGSGYSGPGAPSGSGGKGGGSGQKPAIGMANAPYNTDYIVSNTDYIGYLHNALLVHLDVNMPDFDTVDAIVLKNMYDLSKQFILNCGYFNAKDVNNCFIPLDDYISIVRPFFDVKSLDDVVRITEQTNTYDANQNIIRTSIIKALYEASDMSPEYLYNSNHFQTMETNIINFLNLSQSMQGEDYNGNAGVTPLQHEYLALSIAKYSYALWYKYMYLQNK